MSAPSLLTPNPTLSSGGVLQGPPGRTNHSLGQAKAAWGSREKPSALPSRLVTEGDASTTPYAAVGPAPEEHSGLGWRGVAGSPGTQEPPETLRAELRAHQGGSQHHCAVSGSAAQPGTLQWGLVPGVWVGPPIQTFPILLFFQANSDLCSAPLCLSLSPASTQEKVLFFFFFF